MLTGDEIKRLDIVQGADDRCYRAASYDLRVGVVITPDGSESNLYLLPAQGIVDVVSRERIKLPLDIAGIALVKTSLCNEGVLPLGIGIIDPGYEGKLSSFLVNFGKNHRAIKEGEVFLRLTFYSLTGEKQPDSRRTTIDDSAYLLDKRKNTLEKLGPEFLNIKAIAREVFGTNLVKIVSAAGAAALILTVFTFLLNFGNLLLVQRFLQPSDQTKAELLQNDLTKQNTVIVSP
jgi:deoxycytidine triphosphate deaminase